MYASSRVDPELTGGKTRGRVLLAFGLLLVSAQSVPVLAHGQARTLDGFDHAADWSVVTSDQVSGSLREVDGIQGRALCLDYDFNGVSGYVGLQRKLPMEYPADYQFSFQLRGDAPVNDLQFKLVDASGDNVWWVNRPKVELPAQWTPVVYKKRHISRAWGPSPDPAMHRSASVEFTVYSSAGGAGAVCFDSLVFRERTPDDGSPLTATASVEAGEGVGDVEGKASVDAVAVSAVTDGDPETVWRARFQDGADLVLDLGRLREFGGLSLQWGDRHASDYAIALSNDRRLWRDVRRVTDGNGGRDWIALPESEARYLRLRPMGGTDAEFALAGITIEPLGFASTPNDFIRAIAATAPRGHYPRGFVGVQPYWTVVGTDGGAEQGLIGEDGAVEVARGGIRIEPFVISDGELVSWADVEASQSLLDGYLPIPTVGWRHPQFDLAITPFAEGRPGQSQLSARYVLTNTSGQSRDYTLALALRPLQVNPPSQFLSTPGGVSPINRLAFDASGGSLSAQAGVWTVNGERKIAPSQVPDATIASTFDAGTVVERLAARAATGFQADPEPPDDLVKAGIRARVEHDPTGLASGAMLYRVRLAAGESRSFDWRAPLTGDLAVDGVLAGDAAARQARAAIDWHDKLDRVTLEVPAAGQHVVDTLRTGLAHMLISRNGPQLRPGTRSYARTWIRDGAMISEGLLRLGRGDVAEAFVRWHAPYQFDSGKVPCCVDDRGSDPVPENDSHGELIFTIAEVYRHRRDRQVLEDLWPHVAAAVAYMDQLRLSERTAANRAINPAFYGMMPASISHEGYSAKPMHSYWDNFWTLRGYKDAVLIAQWLGRDADAERFAASRDQFRADLYASIEAATGQHDIDYIPGAAELGDFDATSTTIALAPGGEQGRMPTELLHNTFERYWREFVGRRDGTRDWKDYTPYELRTVGTFVRLGWRERAHEALAFFFADQQPPGWNQWAEVVSRTPRKPFFLGDLPHAWVASDYVRSALDLFAYSREIDQSLVIAAGIPASWLDGQGIVIDGLRTPYGELGYTLHRDGDTVRLKLHPGIRLPPGGVVLRLPKPMTGGNARIDGEPRPWQGSELRIDRLQADVEVGVSP
ncbi:discoidin domain-containing protein [Lysobacter sp. A378]